MSKSPGTVAHSHTLGIGALGRGVKLGRLSSSPPPHSSHHLFVRLRYQTVDGCSSHAKACAGDHEQCNLPDVQSIETVIASDHEEGTQACTAGHQRCALPGHPVVFSLKLLQRRSTSRSQSLTLLQHNNIPGQGMIWPWLSLRPPQSPWTQWRQSPLLSWRCSKAPRPRWHSLPPPALYLPR